MMLNKIKPTYYHFEKRKRKKFLDNEIFFDTCVLLLQSKYTDKLTYYFYKRRLNDIFYTTIKNRCLLTNNSRSVYSFLKISKVPFSRNMENLPGFYRSI